MTKIGAIPFQKLDTERFIEACAPGARLALTEEAKKRVRAGEAAVKKLLAEGKIIYGVNTGIGDFCTTVLPKDKLLQLQKNIILSHACGSAPYLEEPIARGALFLLINERSKGYSGITEKLAETLLTFFNGGITPLLPVTGSLGASGDLIPLAHLGLALMGKGKGYRRGEIIPAADALRILKIRPYVLQPKEALGIINGTAVSAAQSAFAIHGAQRLSGVSNRATAAIFEILGSSTSCLPPELHKLKPHAGQIAVADFLRKNIAGSKLCDRKGGKIQDSYVIRCAPQIDGAVLDQLERGREVVETEMNSVTDNPLIFTEGGEPRAISGGNFHGQNVAFAMDLAGIALAASGKAMAKRTERLINPALSGLPAFLSKDGGLNSGFMITHYLATALLAENTVLANTISAEAPSVSAGQEDMVSMSMTSARKAYQILLNCERILAVELLSVAQAMDLAGHGKRSAIKLFSKPAQALYQKVRSVSATLEADRWLSWDIEKITGRVHNREVSVI